MIEAAAQRVIAKTRAHWESTMERREVVDLFGETVVIEISESKAVRKPTRPNGYAAQPGTGPAGERCKTCEHSVGTGNYGGRTYWKCELIRPKWTGGPGTDILLRSPACRLWEKERPRVDGKKFEEKPR